MVKFFPEPAFATEVLASVTKVWDWAGTVSTSETETEEIQSQQARPRLLFGNIRDRDQKNVYFRDQDKENGRDWDR